MAVAAGQPWCPDMEDWHNLLEGRPLRSYHATRLLPHEVDSIRTKGLQALSPGLLDTRIDDAERLGYIDKPQASVMRSANLFAQGRSKGRTGLVGSILGRGTLRHRAAVQGLLCCWGGEALHGHDRDRQQMTSQIGAPSLVILNQAMPIGVKTSLFPDLVTTFREAYQSPIATGSDVIHHGPVSPSCVVDIVDAKAAAASGRFPELRWLHEGPRF